MSKICGWRRGFLYTGYLVLTETQLKCEKAVALPLFHSFNPDLVSNLVSIRVRYRFYCSATPLGKGWKKTINTVLKTKLSVDCLPDN